jgi:hypothetical protein
MENQRSRLAPGSVQRGEGPGSFDCEAPQGSLLDGCLRALRNIAPSGSRCGSSGTPCDKAERVGTCIGVDCCSCRNAASIGTQRISVSIGQSDGMSSDISVQRQALRGFSAYLTRVARFGLESAVHTAARFLRCTASAVNCVGYVMCGRNLLSRNEMHSQA